MPRLVLKKYVMWKHLKVKQLPTLNKKVLKNTVTEMQKCRLKLLGAVNKYNIMPCMAVTAVRL